MKDRDGRLLRAKELLQAKLAAKDEELQAAQVRCGCLSFPLVVVSMCVVRGMVLCGCV